MKFFGIAEQENETPSNTEEILREFVQVNLEQPAEMFFERVHHVGPKTAGKHNQGAGKDGRGNEPVGSCAMCDARSTGPRALEGKNR